MVVLGCSTFQYEVGGNEHIPSVFPLFLVTYLEVPNLLDTSESLLLVLVLISPGVHYCYLSLAAAGSLARQKYPSSSYPTGHFLQWQKSWPHNIIFLLVYCCYHAIHILPLFVILHVDIGSHLPKNCVDPLHPHINSMAPFLCHCLGHQKFLSQTSRS